MGENDRVPVGMWYADRPVEGPCRHTHADRGIFFQKILFIRTLSASPMSTGVFFFQKNTVHHRKNSKKYTCRHAVCRQARMNSDKQWFFEKKYPMSPVDMGDDDRVLRQSCRHTTCRQVPCRPPPWRQGTIFTILSIWHIFLRFSIKIILFLKQTRPLQPMCWLHACTQLRHPLI